MNTNSESVIPTVWWDSYKLPLVIPAPGPGYDEKKDILRRHLSKLKKLRARLALIQGQAVTLKIKLRAALDRSKRGDPSSFESVGRITTKHSKALTEILTLQGQILEMTESK